MKNRLLSFLLTTIELVKAILTRGQKHPLKECYRNHNEAACLLETCQVSKIALRPFLFFSRLFRFSFSNEDKSFHNSIVESIKKEFFLYQNLQNNSVITPASNFFVQRPTILTAIMDFIPKEGSLGLRIGKTNNYGSMVKSDNWIFNAKTILIYNEK